MNREVRLVRNNYVNGYLKRGIDICASLVLLVPAGITVLLMAAAIRLESRGNPFFCQSRVGINGREFRLWKMRTLYCDQFIILARDSELELDSERITRVGRWLRRSKLDELPQLFNVLAGQMSLVGPRPDLPRQVKLYTEVQYQRLGVKPGLTGVVQISGNTLRCWAKRINMDRWYIVNATPLKDLFIIAWTFIAILKGEDLQSDPLGAVAQTSDSPNDPAPNCYVQPHNTAT